MVTMNIYLSGANRGKPMLEFVSSFLFEFYKTSYVSYLASDRQFYIQLDQLCEGIGLDYSSQQNAGRDRFFDSFQFCWTRRTVKTGK
jgi:hypothetical protein